MVRYQNLTRKPELFRAPSARAPLGPGTVYPLNPPLAGPAWNAILRLRHRQRLFQIESDYVNLMFNRL